jgi:5'-3' exonuclease
MDDTKRLLVVDALNMYFRAYIVNPTLSTNGQPIGGTVGFLKILQKLCRETRPDEIVICWDGEGGSRKKKLVNKGYKEGRKPIRLNRDIRNLTDNEEMENKVWQQTRLFEYLNNLAVIQLMLPAVEADDIIAQVVQSPQYSGWQKVIVSSDKDFFQLCDGETVVLRPIQKEIMTSSTIVEKFNIHPSNFALARAIAGDKSDNLPGVRGAGLATIAKRFSFLSEDRSHTLTKILQHCEKVEKPLKVHTEILENKELIQENYKLMQLYLPSISVQGKGKIKYAIENFVPELNLTNFRAMSLEDGFIELAFDELFTTMKRMVVESKTEN